MRTYWGPFVCGNVILAIYEIRNGLVGDVLLRHLNNIDDIRKDLVRCRKVHHPDEVKPGFVSLPESRVFDSMGALKDAQTFSHVGPSDGDALLEWLQHHLQLLQQQQLPPEESAELLQFFRILSRLTTSYPAPLCGVPLRGTSYEDRDD